MHIYQGVHQVLKLMMHLTEYDWLFLERNQQPEE